jgi:hypothetical protein
MAGRADDSVIDRIEAALPDRVFVKEQSRDGLIFE